jgi:hypothetical protein
MGLELKKVPRRPSVISWSRPNAIILLQKIKLEIAFSADMA